jgi:pimeloyl-ACP methyl ester carboxylesterase
MRRIPRSEPWQHRFVEANGLRFHVVTSEAAGGRPARGLVLLLHVRELPKIAAPTLIIWGDRDFALGKELTRGMRAYFSGAFRIAYLPRVSHWVQQEAPAKVNALLTRFLAARFLAEGPRP